MSGDCIRRSGGLFLQLLESKEMIFAVPKQDCVRVYIMRKAGIKVSKMTQTRACEDCQ
jgi:hypothetical protein